MSCQRFDGYSPTNVEMIGNGSLSTFVMDKAGLHLLSIDSDTTGSYQLELSIVGDVNADGKVDGIDSQLLTDGIGGNDNNLDFNGDGNIDETDISLLGGNYGFATNLAPVVTSGSILTHEDLSVTIPLKGYVDDNEGDEIFLTVENVVGGNVRFARDGITAIFEPNAGYTGIGSFELVASDGYSKSDAVTFEVNVSDAPLVNLSFVNRNPQLEIGEGFEIVAIGDFADQEDVILPGDYLTWSSDNELVATVDDGRITATGDGTTIFSASRNGISAVTTSRVGDMPFPKTDEQYNVSLAEEYGLNVYPQSVTLTAGVEREILVSIEGLIESPNLKDDSTGTRYFVSDSSIISVTEDGLITTLKEGSAQVTVINAGVEAIIPVNVENANLGATNIGTQGGIVENNDGYQVLIPEGALTEDATVNITSIELNSLTTPLPEKFEVYNAFNLDFDDRLLEISAQLAIPAPEGLTEGTEVFFLRQGELPDENGNLNPIWFLEESGIVASDGMIRTSSPPWPGVSRGDDYIVAVPKFEYQVGRAYGSFNTLTGFSSTYVGLVGVSAGIATTMGLAMTSGFSFLHEKLVDTIEFIGLSKIGELLFKTDVGVEINPNGLPVAYTSLEVPVLTENNPSIPPIVQEARIDFSEQQEPIVYLKGSNFLIESVNPIVGSSFEDLTVRFSYEYRGQEFSQTSEIIPQLSRRIAFNQYEVAVSVPQTVLLAESSIKLERLQSEISFADPSTRQIVPYVSETGIKIEQKQIDVMLSPNVALDEVAVFNSLNSKEIVNTPGLTSRDLLLARIPVGNENISDYPRKIVANHKANTAYVSLNGSSQIAIIDLISLQQFDLDSSNNTIDGISLPYNAAPHAMAISRGGKYLYVGDYNQGLIYVIDLEPSSSQYHQVIQTINVPSAENGFHSLVVSNDNTKLFATAPSIGSSNNSGSVFVVNIDEFDRRAPSALNHRKWHEVIAHIELDNGMEWVADINTTPDPNILVFATRTNESKGIGRITITNNDPQSFDYSTSYTPLGIGATNDYFDVNEAMEIVIASDGQYGFVVGRNSRNYGQGITSVG